MKSHIFSALLCTMGAALALGADPVTPIVNQIGSIGGSYTGVKELKFAIVDWGTASITATAAATISGGAVTQIAVTNPGAGYTEAPVVTIAPSSPGALDRATAVAAVQNGRISAITITSGESGYTRTPSVRVAAPMTPRAVTTLWSNDGTSVDGSAPSSAVTLNLVRGTYSAFLGHTGLPNMAALPAELLGRTDARVRVWYRSGTRFILVPTDYPLQTIPVANEAIFAESAGTAETVSGGTSSGLAGLPNGVLVASFSADDPALTSQGYTRVQSLAPKEWSAFVALGAPSSRSHHTVVCAGDALVVWGGEVNGVLSNQGGEYSTAATAWTLLPTLNAPAARRDHTAVWTGSQMLVWGGFTSTGTTNTGGIYVQAGRFWRPTSLTNVPADRYGHTAVWTGTHMIVWGGINGAGALNSGAAFAPPSNPAGSGPYGVWTTLSTSNAPSPRRGHSAVWTGTKMFIWGGLDASGQALADGRAFDPASNTWTSLPTPPPTVLSPRFGHTAIWTGTKMIIFGGANSDVGSTSSNLFNDGAAFDPASNTWSALLSSGGPERRVNHGAVWSGVEMLVFSGDGVGGVPVLSCAAYSPARNAWRPLPLLPSNAAGLVGAWSGSALMVFGTTGLFILDPTAPLHFYGRF